MKEFLHILRNSFCTVCEIYLFIMGLSSNLKNHLKSFLQWKQLIILYYIILYCIALYCIVLYCIALHCIALHCIALHCIALHCIVLHCIALHCIVLHCIVLYCIVLYCIALRCNVLHYIILHYSTMTRLHRDRNNTKLHNNYCAPPGCCCWCCCCCCHLSAVWVELWSKWTLLLFFDWLHPGPTFDWPDVLNIQCHDYIFTCYDYIVMFEFLQTEFSFFTNEQTKWS